jgi:hypothetical protein
MKLKMMLVCAALLTGCRKEADTSSGTASKARDSRSNQTTVVPTKKNGDSSTSTSRPTVSDERSRLIDSEWNAYSDVAVTHDASTLSASTKSMLRHLLEAGRITEELYMLEIHPDNLKWRDMVSVNGSELDKKLFLRNRMPWCEDNTASSCTVLESAGPREIGRIFWPEGFDQNAVSSLSREINAEELSSPFTVVRKKEDTPGYAAIPFAGFDLFGPKMKKVSEELKAAAGFAEDPSLKKFLLERASAFISLNPFSYDSSDYDWIALSSDMEVTVGPYEVYKSAFQSKAMFEMIIGFEDKTLGPLLSDLKRDMQGMENSLSALVGEALYMPRTLDPRIAIRAVDVWAAFGDARQSRGALLAYHLPNRGKSVNEGLYKKVILVNHAETLESMSKTWAALAVEASQQSYLSFRDDMINTAYHELAHGFGAFSDMRINDVGGRLTTVKESLGEYESLFEELKAEAMALWLSKIQHDIKTIDDETLKRRYVSALIHTLGMLQYPLNDTYAKAAVILLGQLIDAGALERNADTGEMKVVFEKMDDAVTEFLKEVATIQLTGDAASAVSKVKKYLIKTETGYVASPTITDIRSDGLKKYRKAEIKTPSLRYVISGL